MQSHDSNVYSLNLYQKVNVVSTLIHHQNATCGVSCGSIPPTTYANTTPGAAALHLASCW